MTTPTNSPIDTNRIYRCECGWYGTLSLRSAFCHQVDVRRDGERVVTVFRNDWQCPDCGAVLAAETFETDFDVWDAFDNVPHRG